MTLKENDLDLQTYLPLALRTEKPLATPVARLNHAALGIVSETGELATPVKRVSMYGKAMDEIGKDGKTLGSIAAYAIAILASPFLPALSLLLYALVAALWLIPDRRIEKAMKVG